MAEAHDAAKPMSLEQQVAEAVLSTGTDGEAIEAVGVAIAPILRALGLDDDATGLGVVQAIGRLKTAGPWPTHKQADTAEANRELRAELEAARADQSFIQREHYTQIKEERDKMSRALKRVAGINEETTTDVLMTWVDNFSTGEPFVSPKTHRAVVKSLVEERDRLNAEIDSTIAERDEARRSAASHVEGYRKHVVALQGALGAKAHETLEEAARRVVAERGAMRHRAEAAERTVDALNERAANLRATRAAFAEAASWGFPHPPTDPEAPDDDTGVLAHIREVVAERDQLRQVVANADADTRENMAACRRAAGAMFGEGLEQAIKRVKKGAGVLHEQFVKAVEKVSAYRAACSAALGAADGARDDYLLKALGPAVEAAREVGRITAERDQAKATISHLYAMLDQKEHVIEHLRSALRKAAGELAVNEAEFEAHLTRDTTVAK